MSPIIQMTHFTSEDIEKRANNKPMMHLTKSDIKQSRKQTFIFFTIFASFMMIFTIYDFKQISTQISSLKEINVKHEQRINSLDASITTAKKEINSLTRQKNNLDNELTSQHALNTQTEQSYNEENKEIDKITKEIAKLHIEVDELRRQNINLRDKASILNPYPFNKWKYDIDGMINPFRFRHDLEYENMNMPYWLRNRFIRPY